MTIRPQPGKARLTHLTHPWKFVAPRHRFSRFSPPPSTNEWPSKSAHGETDAEIGSNFGPRLCLPDLKKLIFADFKAANRCAHRLQIFAGRDFLGGSVAVASCHPPLGAVLIFPLGNLRPIR
jgi:hypothetical protein